LAFLLPNSLFHCSLILCFLSLDFAKIHLDSCLFLSTCSGHQLKYRELHSHIHLRENFYCKGDQTLWVAQRGCGVSILADTQNAAGQGPGQSCRCLERCLWTVSTGLFSPQLFCDWVNFSMEGRCLLYCSICSSSTVPWTGSSSHPGT